MRFAIVVLLLLLPMVPTVLAIKDVVHRPFAEPQKKMIWLLVIIFLPPLGGITYFLFKKLGKKTDKIA